MLYKLLLFLPVLHACQLCFNGLEGLRNPHHYVNDRGKNCAMLTIEMFPMKADSKECLDHIHNYRTMCCLSSKPPIIPQVPKPHPKFQGQRGPHKPCDICYNKKYPKNPSMVINMLYLGAGSCAQYYLYGEGGLIPNHLCPALQYFAFEPCGC